MALIRLFSDEFSPISHGASYIVGIKLFNRKVAILLHSYYARVERNFIQNITYLLYKLTCVDAGDVVAEFLENPKHVTNAHDTTS